MKILLFLFLSVFGFASDGTPEYQIWIDLGITAQEYYYLSAMSGITFGFVFALSLVLLFVRR